MIVGIASSLTIFMIAVVVLRLIVRKQTVRSDDWIIMVSAVRQAYSMGSIARCAGEQS
jgi:hypothetical protein